MGGMWHFDTSPNYVRALALLVAIVGALVGGMVAYHAARNEITGKAIYHRPRSKGSNPEPVTREDSPAKFRQATNSLWLISGFPLVVAAIGLIFFRKLDDCANSYF